MGLNFVLLANCAPLYVFCDPIVHAVPSHYHPCFLDRFITPWMLCPWAYLVGTRPSCTYILPYMTHVN